MSSSPLLGNSLLISPPPVSFKIGIGIGIGIENDRWAKTTELIPIPDWIRVENQNRKIMREKPIPIPIPIPIPNRKNAIGSLHKLGLAGFCYQ
jgi:hypothetical protein